MHTDDHVARCREMRGHRDPAFCRLVHDWIDAPYHSVVSPIHRLWRHWPDETPLEALQLFGSPAHECVIQHIVDDHATTQQMVQIGAVSVLLPMTVAMLVLRDGRRKVA